MYVPSTNAFSKDLILKIRFMYKSPPNQNFKEKNHINHDLSKLNV